MTEYTCFTEAVSIVVNAMALRVQKDNLDIKDVVYIYIRERPDKVRALQLTGCFRTTDNKKFYTPGVSFNPDIKDTLWESLNKDFKND